MSIQEEAKERFALAYLETDRFRQKLPMIAVIMGLIPIVFAAVVIGFCLLFGK